MAKFLHFIFLGRPSPRQLPLPLLLAALLLLPVASVCAAPIDGIGTKVTENASLALKVDQVGYPLDGPKVALVGVPAGR